MDEQRQADDEIDLIDLIAVIWRYKLVIVLVTVLAGGAAAAYSTLGDDPVEDAPPPAEEIYVADSLLLFEPSVYSNAEGATVRPVARSYSTLAVRIADRLVARADIDGMNLETLYGIDADAHGGAVRTAIADTEVQIDEDDAYLVHMQTSGDNPEAVVTAIEELTGALRRRFEEIGLADDRAAFVVVEPAGLVDERVADEPPPEARGRNPAVIVVVAVFAGLFLGVFLAFVLNYINQVRKDPEAMRKLKGEAR